MGKRIETEAEYQRISARQMELESMATGRRLSAAEMAEHALNDRLLDEWEMADADYVEPKIGHRHNDNDDEQEWS